MFIDTYTLIPLVFINGDINYYANGIDGKKQYTLSPMRYVHVMKLFFAYTFKYLVVMQILLFLERQPQYYTSFCKVWDGTQ